MSQNKIRRTLFSFKKLEGKIISIYSINSAWDGSNELLEHYVRRVTKCGVWFDNGGEDSRFWVNIKNLNNCYE